jgi:hypothetical protein
MVQSITTRKLTDAEVRKRMGNKEFEKVKQQQAKDAAGKDKQAKIDAAKPKYKPAKSVKAPKPAGQGGYGGAGDAARKRAIDEQTG